jgi:hypothetical protein
MNEPTSQPASPENLCYVWYGMVLYCTLTTTGIDDVAGGLGVRLNVRLLINFFCSESKHRGGLMDIWGDICLVAGWLVVAVGFLLWASAYV